MSIRVLKFLALSGVLLTATGAEVCLGPCDPKYVYVTLDEFDPANGTVVSTPTMTMTFIGTEEFTVKVARYADPTISACLCKWDGDGWTGLPAEPDWEISGAVQNGRCSFIRDVSVTFEDVALDVGANRFRVVMEIYGIDFNMGTSYSEEVTYTYQP